MAEDSSKPPANATATASATSAPAPAAAPAAPLFPPNDPAVTGYYPSARWRNLWNIVTGRMTPDGQEEYREAVYIRDEAIDCARCVEWRDWCFQHSPTVRFLREKTAALNGDLGPDNVVCHRCPAWRDESGRLVRQSGGFSPNHGIKICANELRNRKHLEDTLAHEMVHAWDHLRWKMDWMELRHAACTEVSLLRPAFWRWWAGPRRGGEGWKQGRHAGLG